METRTILLALHITSAAAWLGADLVLHAIGGRIAAESRSAATVYARTQVWLHQRYYGIVVLGIFVTGILLVLDGDWSWSTEFIWVGLAAVVGGGALGGGRLGPLAQQKLDALEADDQAAADAIQRKMRKIEIAVTILPLVAVYSMVDKLGL